VSDCEASVKTARRYYLGKRRKALEVQDNALADVWRAKQEAEPGQALALTFPHRSKLEALGYTTVEDLDGANQDELISAGLLRREAAAVLAALE